MISKEEIEKLKLDQVEGEILGMILKEDLQFVLKEEGKEGLEKVEKEMESLGYPLKLKEIRDFSWYPEKMNLVMFVIQKIFAWPDEKFRRMGQWAAKISFLARIMMRYFVSIERVAKEVGKYWRKAHSAGFLEVEEINKKEHFMIVALKDFNTITRAHCLYLEGYFWQIASYILPKENLKSKEIECPFQGGKIHKFKISW